MICRSVRGLDRETGATVIRRNSPSYVEARPERLPMLCAESKSVAETTGGCTVFVGSVCRCWTDLAVDESQRGVAVASPFWNGQPHADGADGENYADRKVALGCDKRRVSCHYGAERRRGGASHGRIDVWLCKLASPGPAVVVGSRR